MFRILLISIICLIEILAGNVHDASVTTENNCLNFDFKHKIINFLNYPVEDGDYIQSPVFLTKAIEHGYELTMYARVYSSKKLDSVRANLFIESQPSSNGIKISASFVISVLDSDSKFYGRKSVESRLFSGTNGFGGELVNLSGLRKYLSSYLPDGHLTIKFAGAVCWLVETPIPTLPPVESFNSTDLAGKMVETLFRNGTGYDVIIRSSDRTFKCHKAILSLRSEYFRKKIQSQAIKSESDDYYSCNETILDFSDIMNGEELGDTLEYLYFGKTTNLDKTCRKLFEMSGEFGLMELRELSETALIRQLNDDNARELLKYSRQHKAKRLRKEAALLVVKNYDINQEYDDDFP